MKAAQLLLSKGSDINIKGFSQPLLHTAISTKEFNEDLIYFLVSRGADINLKNNYGRNARDVIISYRNANAVSIIRKVEEVYANFKNNPGSDICSCCFAFSGENKKFSTCSKCKTQKYCSVDCQKNAWKTHKQVCKEKDADPNILDNDIDAEFEVFSPVTGRKEILLYYRSMNYGKEFEKF